MSENCPICQTVLKDKPATDAKGFAYECPRCGNFILSHYTKADLQRTYIDAEANGEKEEKVAVISHATRKMQKESAWPTLDGELIRAILKNPLPSLTEQINNFIHWLAENVKGPGEEVLIEASTHQAIMGSKTPNGFALIIKHLFDTGILTGKTYRDGIGKAHVILSVEGWQYYDQLKRRAIDSRKAFMAMEYGDKGLDEIVENYFKPAVACTGFELCRLDQPGKAGLIDDRLRVEIRNSRFLISDLTHENRGAYWEAGYAEGLGKPVIYTCEQKKFEENKTHFDTNHHLTVTWNENNPQEAMETLKATIRATLPDEAKLSDD